MDSGLEEEKRELHDEAGGEGTAAPERKRRFGRGIYQSKDVPIRLLDGLIAGLLAAILILTVIFAVNGGFRITFDSQGGSEVAYQTLRHGSMVTEPEEPARPGYVFAGWYQEEAEEPWNFSQNTIGGDLTLYARWEPASITVKLDPAGGSFTAGEDSPAGGAAEKIVVYGSAYGELPVPERSGFDFDGWYYSGGKIDEQTTVTMPGEHVLTARWKNK